MNGWLFSTDVLRVKSIVHYVAVILFPIKLCILAYVIDSNDHVRTTRLSQYQNLDSDWFSRIEGHHV